MSEKRTEDSGGMYAGAGSTPVPDPTEKTTAALLREVAAVRELFQAEFQCHKEARESLRTIIETRLDAQDEAVKLLQDTADKFPARIDEKISSLRSIHEEKFRSISTQFAERDTRSEQASKDSKVAIDAALQAQKESVGEQNKSSALAIAKSENATMKVIDAMNEKINDVKARQDRDEGRSKGSSDIWGYIAAAVGLLIGVAGIAVAILKR